MPNDQPLPLSAPPKQRDTPRLLAWGIAALVSLLVAAGGLAWAMAQQPAPIVIAFASTMTGAGGLETEVRSAIQIYLDQINAAGGVDGRKVLLQDFDDQGRPAVAKANVAAILKSPAVAVLGHSLSTTSVAAGPGYLAGHIAALTGLAGADEVTVDNPWYFQAVSPDTVQGAFMAEYIHTVLLNHATTFFRVPEIDLVTSDDPYGSSFWSGFLAGNTGAPPKMLVVESGDAAEVSAARIAAALTQTPEPRIIVLGVAPDATPPLLRAIRRHGIRSTVILAGGAADDAFAKRFANEPEELDSPGFFTDNVFAIAPMILDNTGQLGQELVASVEAQTRRTPGWNAAAGQDAARLLVAALRRAHLSGTPTTLDADRDAVRTALAGINSPVTAVPGINGPLYFNSNRQMSRSLQFGFFREGRIVSAPLQLVRVQNPDLVDIDREVEQGHIVQIGEEFFWLQRVVYTGVELTRLNRVDVKEGTFNVDFYFWMRYAGTDDLPTQVRFSDFTGSFDPAKPLQSRSEDGLNYRLYQVSGTFKASYDLHDYPFDQQSLVIRLQNSSHPLQEIAYVIDAFGLQLDKPSHDAAASEAFRNLEVWQVVAVRPFVDSFSVSSTLGEPALFNTPNRVVYAGLNTAIVLKRNVVAFMMKTLIPLFLLALVVFATLFFPPTLAKERTTIPVTGILTSAVMLISISNNLPPLGYTVALEYIFYIFFFLCLNSMVFGFLAEIFRNRKYHGHSVAVDVIGRIIYVTVALATLAVFWWHYGALGSARLS